jgi:hypothetical protein
MYTARFPKIGIGNVVMTPLKPPIYSTNIPQAHVDRVVLS